MAVHNTLGDLSNFMFEQMERLNDATSDQLAEEVQRSKAMSDVARTIIENSNTMLEVMRFQDNALSADSKVPRILGPGE